MCFANILFEEYFYDNRNVNGLPRITVLVVISSSKKLANDSIYAKDTISGRFVRRRLGSFKQLFNLRAGSHKNISLQSRFNEDASLNLTRYTFFCLFAITT